MDYFKNLLKIFSIISLSLTLGCAIRTTYKKEIVIPEIEAMVSESEVIKGTLFIAKPDINLSDIETNVGQILTFDNDEISKKVRKSLLNGFNESGLFQRNSTTQIKDSSFVLETKLTSLSVNPAMWVTSPYTANVNVTYNLRDYSNVTIKKGSVEANGIFTEGKGSFSSQVKINYSYEPIWIALSKAVEKIVNEITSHQNTILSLRKSSFSIKTAEPVQHKPAVHIAYPKGSEQIADERVNLLGYVTSTNKTESLKLFVNQKRQFVDELWRDTPINVVGLRGYPLDLSVPIEKGKNIIEIRVLDHEGFMVNHKIEVNRIEIAETQIASSISLGERLRDIELTPQNKQVNENNFAVVIEDWVKQTAVSDFNKGNRMYDAGRLERAAYYYRKAVRTDPLAPAFFNLGLTLQGLGNESEARQAFEKACEQKEERACAMISQ